MDIAKILGTSLPETIRTDTLVEGMSLDMMSARATATVGCEVADSDCAWTAKGSSDTMAHAHLGRGESGIGHHYVKPETGAKREVRAQRNIVLDAVDIIASAIDRTAK